MVAILLSNLVPLNSAPASTSSHFTPNLSDPRLITQYGEARRSKPLDSAKALPDTLACEGSKKFAEVSKKKKGKKRKKKKCEVLLEGSQAKEKVK